MTIKEKTIQKEMKTIGGSSDPADFDNTIGIYNGKNPPLYPALEYMPGDPKDAISVSGNVVTAKIRKPKQGQPIEFWMRREVTTTTTSTIPGLKYYAIYQVTSSNKGQTKVIVWDINEDKVAVIPGIVFPCDYTDATYQSWYSGTAWVGSELQVYAEAELTEFPPYGAENPGRLSGGGYSGGGYPMRNNGCSPVSGPPAIPGAHCPLSDSGSCDGGTVFENTIQTKRARQWDWDPCRHVVINEGTPEAFGCECSFYSNDTQYQDGWVTFWNGQINFPYRKNRSSIVWPLQVSGSNRLFGYNLQGDVSLRQLHTSYIGPDLGLPGQYEEWGYTYGVVSPLGSMGAIATDGKNCFSPGAPPECGSPLPLCDPLDGVGSKTQGWPGLEQTNGAWECVDFITQVFVFSNVEVNFTTKHIDAWDFVDYGSTSFVCHATAGRVLDVKTVDPYTLPRNATLEGLVESALNSMASAGYGPLGVSLSANVRVG